VGRRALTVALALAACSSKPATAPCPAVADGAPPVVVTVGPDAAVPEPRADLMGGRHDPHHDHELTAEGKPVVPCPAAGDELDVLLDRAARLYDGGELSPSLACADRAAHLYPASIEAHHDRALALAGLERWDEARLAFARALALDPADPETLAGAADFYVNMAPPSHEATELGLEYARKGALLLAARKSAPPALTARVAWIEAQALDDLGRTDEALARIEAAYALARKDPAIAQLRAVILFHMGRFAEADAAFAALPPPPSGEDPFELWHRGLIAERRGRQTEADGLLARAHALAPAEFPDPAILPTPAAFRALVDQAVAELPADLRAALAKVSLEVADLPSEADLRSVSPPFAPTILGLYRGAPLGEPSLPGDPPRAIVLYRKNLARAVLTAGELAREVRVTLWHEIGHLRGADEHDLRDRGLQ
jgi:predicted Zn-dependent protease with MMP-like domain